MLFSGKSWQSRTDFFQTGCVRHASVPRALCMCVCEAVFILAGIFDLVLVFILRRKCLIFLVTF